VPPLPAGRRPDFLRLSEHPELHKQVNQRIKHTEQGCAGQAGKQKNARRGFQKHAELLHELSLLLRSHHIP